MPMHRLLFIGDSLIEFYDWRQCFPGHEVINLGMAGETTEGLLRRLDAITDQLLLPDLIVIMTGINNAAMEDFGFLHAYAKVLQKLRTAYPGAQILANSLLPVLLPWFDAAIIPSLNDKLKLTCQQQRVSYFNLYDLFVDEKGRARKDYLLNDGVHLSRRGYEAWSAALANFLEQKD